MKLNNATQFDLTPLEKDDSKKKLVGFVEVVRFRFISFAIRLIH